MSYVTLPYPLKSMEAPPEYRGAPRIDPALCVGCGACSRACPPDAIVIEDLISDRVRRVKVDVARCIRCARCEEVCPTGAIRLTREFELSTPRKEDLVQVVELRLAKCSICGKPTGYTERQVRFSKMILEHLPDDVRDELVSKMTLCSECRRALFAEELAKVHPGLPVLGVGEG